MITPADAIPYSIIRGNEKSIVDTITSGIDDAIKNSLYVDTSVSPPVYSCTVSSTNILSGTSGQRPIQIFLYVLTEYENIGWTVSQSDSDATKFILSFLF